MEMRDSKETHPKSATFFEQLWGNRSIKKFQGVLMTDILKVEEILQLNIFLYDIDFVDGESIGELAQRCIQKFEKSVKSLRYNNHICNVSDVISFFKSFRAAAHVTQSFQRLEISGDIRLHIASESSTFIQRMYTS